MELQGSILAAGFRFAIIVSRFNAEITEGLLTGARAALESAQVRADDITLVRVPGAFEIPVMARRLAETGRFDAIICLGCVIKGETMHFEYIAAAVSQGIMDVGTATGATNATGDASPAEHRRSGFDGGLRDDRGIRDGGIGRGQNPLGVRHVGLRRLLGVARHDCFGFGDGSGGLRRLRRGGSRCGNDRLWVSRIVSDGQVSTACGGSHTPDGQHANSKRLRKHGTLLYDVRMSKRRAPVSSQILPENATF
jgi:6,7-dimethyl-8-ribityllumazine synthase